MSGPPPSIRHRSVVAQANTRAGLPHAGVQKNLQPLVEKALSREPKHADPVVDWTHNPTRLNPARSESPTATDFAANTAASADAQSDYSDQNFGLVAFLKPSVGQLILAACLVAAETIAFQMGPVVTQIGVDKGIVGDNHGVLVGAALAYIALLGVATLTGAVRVAFTGRLGERLMERLRIRVFGHMQRMDTDFFNNEKAGVLLARMTSDIETLSTMFQEGIVNLAVQSLTLLLIAVMLFIYDPVLAAVTIVVSAPPAFALSYWFRNRSNADYRRVRNRIGDLLSNLQESLAGIKVIVAHNRQLVSITAHEREVERYRDAKIRTSQANSLYAPSSESIGIATQALLLGVGGAMTASGRITVGELAAYLLFLTTFFAPVQALVQLYNSYQQGNAAVTKLKLLLSTSPSVTEKRDAKDLPAVSGGIVFEDVTFGYQPGKPVLHNLNLRISPGETLALVGPTGAGKTTLAKLINRSYDPDAGTVRIDGHDLRDVTLQSLRSQVGVVPQEPFLFVGTVRDNVGFANSDIEGDAELIEALTSVGAMSAVERIGGLDGIIHERGADLSAGERQLLALARTFVARSRVLILDEATGNLDLLSETAVDMALSSMTSLRGSAASECDSAIPQQNLLTSKRTTVIIAHRLATTLQADRIAVIENGHVTEIGNHDELISKDGYYAQMWALYR